MVCLLAGPRGTGSGWKRLLSSDLLIVCDPAGAPLAPPDILEELDQVRVENLLIKLFDQLGAPDRLTICASDDWDDDAWKIFSQDHRVEIRFQRFDRSGPDELRALARTVVLRFAREEDSVPRSKEVARGLVNTALRVRSPGARKSLYCAPHSPVMRIVPRHASNWPTWSFSTETGRSASRPMTR